MEIKVGIGYDSHQLAGGRDLILGGVKVPFEKGLMGHSDGDVLVHAIIDALLGATGKGDIGTCFPDTDPRYKDISSLLLLREVKGMLDVDKWGVGNIDATIIAERPRLSPFIPYMKQKIAQVLSIPQDKIEIKAKTNEGMGFIGRGEGVAAIVVALVFR